MKTEEIKIAKAENPNLFSRDLAEKIGISEARLLSAEVGHTAVQIQAQPDKLIPWVEKLGEVMALTRNESCVIEKVGVYQDYQGGAHASMVINKQIDLRFFPKPWVYAFAVEQENEKGTKRSIQVFDAAGDAIHKIFLRPESILEEWSNLIADLRLETQAEDLNEAERKPTDPARGDPGRADELRGEWDKLKDTHQFIRLVHKMKMNRLGSYRIAGEPHARALAPTCVEAALTELAGTGIESFTFVGNLGCIQIHHGAIVKTKQVGSWFNILDPGYNLHLRTDHIAEVYAVTKSTSDGPTISIEAFDANGMIILQIFGSRRSKSGDFEAFQDMVNAMPTHPSDVKETA